MDIRATTQKEVLEAVKQRFIRLCPEQFSEGNTLIDDDELPQNEDGWMQCLRLMVGDGQGSGAGPCATMEHFSINLTFLHLSQSPSSHARLDYDVIGDDRSLLGYWKPLLIRTMLVDVDRDGAKHLWEPRDELGNFLLSESLTYAGCRGPRRVHEAHTAITLSFNTAITWNLA